VVAAAGVRPGSAGGNDGGPLIKMWAGRTGGRPTAHGEGAPMSTSLTAPAGSTRVAAHSVRSPAQNGDMRTVLVVEDERDIRELLRRYLERAGFSVLTAATGAEALHLVEEVQPDLLILDLGLPDIDGAEVLAAAARSTPTIVLTSRTAVADRIAGLRAGADDYVVKPFSPTEVVLRVQAVLARGPRTERALGPRSFGDGRLVIDEAAHRVQLDGRHVHLTPHEWGILVALSGAPGRVLSRRELAAHAGGYPFEGDDRAVDSHVKNLRHKFGPDTGEVIETVLGFGYRLALAADE
jgi:DNA-binding response OmpR family regulator